jgi:RNA polymerase sigma-70 factor (ECF subfamily)
VTDAAIDQALLARARAGNPEAHEVLYRTYASMVFTLACRMLGSRAAAEDVVQDSFVEVIRKVPDFRGEGDIRAWIKRIAINKCLSHLRSPWIARRVADVVEDATPAVMSGVAAAFEPERVDEAARSFGGQQELAGALAAISPTARAVVWLHDVEGYTHGEIGRLMGRSTSFSKSQLSRAYRELRRILQPEESDRESEPCLRALKTV